MSDVENLIRSALRDRATEVTPDRLRGPSPATKSPEPRRWLAAVVASAAVVILAVGLSIWSTQRESHPQPAASPAVGISGYQWNLTSITDARGSYQYQPGVPDAAFLVFLPDGEVGGSDGVNYLSGVTDPSDPAQDGRYHLTSRGYEITGEIYQTSVGYVGSDPRVVASRGAIDAALTTGHDIDATVVGHILTVHVAGYTLTLQRGAPVAIPPPPTPTTPLPRTPGHTGATS